MPFLDHEISVMNEGNLGKMLLVGCAGSQTPHCHVDVVVDDASHFFAVHFLVVSFCMHTL